MTHNIKCITHDSFCRSETQEQLSQVVFVVLRVSCAVTFRLAAAGTFRETEQHEAGGLLLL